MPRPTDAPRTYRLHIRLEETGYKFLRDIAEEFGMTITALAREIVYREMFNAISAAVRQTGGVVRGRTRRQAHLNGVQNLMYVVGSRRHRRVKNDAGQDNGNGRQGQGQVCQQEGLDGRALSGRIGAGRGGIQGRGLRTDDEQVI